MTRRALLARLAALASAPLVGRGLTRYHVLYWDAVAGVFRREWRWR